MKEILTSQFKDLSFKEYIAEADALAQSGFYTPAFLRRWQIVEMISRILMINESACSAAEKTSEKLFQVLKKQNIDISKNNLNTQMQNILISSARDQIESHFKYINVSQVEKALKCLEAEYDPHKLAYLLATNVKEQVSDAPIKKTIREQRNEIVHKNNSIDQKRHDELIPFFDHFFDIITQVIEKASQAR